MQIPGSRKTVNPATDIASLSLLKPLPSLVAVTITLSSLLTYFYRITYLLFAVCVFWVLFPWVLGNPFWLIVLASGWCGLWTGYQYQTQTLFSGMLWFERGEWILKVDMGTPQKYQLAGEVLCWSLLIILPMQSIDSGQRKYLLIANDALSPIDRARLRTWIRVCLRPKS
ncbi:protein YgfX [Cellvibrio mixtus]|uniref:protein YgfX n=1 Tax=Cellvibrio mixtus TaxID=39650 RepID=UPI001269C373|nr:protein YgfX [Cellvibrio mixtus]